MKKGIFLFLCAWIGTTHAAVYTVNTENFDLVFGSYTTNDNITGTIVTGSNVTPNVGLVDVSSDLISYSFTDGVQTLNETNSTILAFSLAVNGSNQLTGSAITIWSSPITTQPGGNVRGMDVYFNAISDNYSGFIDGICQENGGPGGACSSAIPAQTNSGSYFFFDPIFANGFD